MIDDASISREAAPSDAPDAYWRRLGCRQDPCATVSAGSVFASPAFVQLQHALFRTLRTSTGGLTLLTGAEGVGKTTLLQTIVDALRTVGETVIFHRCGPDRQLLEADLAAIIDDRGKRESTLLLEGKDAFDWRAGTRDRSNRILLLDGAEEWDDAAIAVFERAMSRAEGLPVSARVVIAFRSETEARIQRVISLAISSDLSFTRLRVEPLESGSAGDFLLHRMRAAGFAGTLPLAPETLARLESESGGLPGRLLVLASVELARIVEPNAARRMAPMRSAIGRSEFPRLALRVALGSAVLATIAGGTALVLTWPGKPPESTGAVASPAVAAGIAVTPPLPVPPQVALVSPPRELAVVPPAPPPVVVPTLEPLTGAILNAPPPPNPAQSLIERFVAESDPILAPESVAAAHAIRPGLAPQLIAGEPMAVSEVEDEAIIDSVLARHQARVETPTTVATAPPLVVAQATAAAAAPGSVPAAAAPTALSAPTIATPMVLDGAPDPSLEPVVVLAAPAAPIAPLAAIPIAADDAEGSDSAAVVVHEPPAAGPPPLLVTEDEPPPAAAVVVHEPTSPPPPQIVIVTQFDPPLPGVVVMPLPAVAAPPPPQAIPALPPPKLIVEPAPVQAVTVIPPPSVTAVAASAPPAPVVSPASAAPPSPPAATLAPMPPPLAVAPPPTVPAVVQHVPSPPPSAQALPPPSAPPARNAAPSPAAQAQAARDVERGDAMMQTGDVAAARLFYERAAAAGSRQAMTALARTYDPEVLRQLGVVGLAPDPQRAQFWYGRAAEPTR